MKAIILPVLLIFCGALQIFAQEENSPIKWKLNIEKIPSNLVKNERIDVDLTAEIEAGWHLYALEKVDDGPIPTRITLAENQPFKLEKITAPKPVEQDDSAFGVVTKFYNESVKFTLPVILMEDLTPETVLKVRVRFQTCNDRICLPPKVVILESNLKSVD